MFTESLLNFFIQQQLDLLGQKIAVACSGGADSMALLNSLLSLRKSLKLEVYALHFNHHLRGKESNEDAQFVKDFCKKSDCHFLLGSANIKKIAASEKKSIEVAAREARYTFFEKTLKKNKIPYLLTAHHADDQTETLLMNFIRGTGLEGLKGIEPLANRGSYTLLRPFLSEERSKILQYLKAQNIAYREDSSNADPAFWRNKIRHQILPLVKTINPGINHSLTQMVEIVREELVEQEKTVQGLFKLCLLKQTQKEIQLSASKLYTLPLAQQRRVIRKAYSELKGGLRNISFDFVKNFMTNQLDCLYTAKQKIQARKMK